MQSIHSIYSCTVCLLVLTALHVVPCRAQPVLAPHDRVRMRILSSETRRMHSIKGVVRRIDANHIEISGSGDDAARRFAVADIVRIERSAVDGTHAGWGAAIGALGFGTIGAVWSYAATDPCRPTDFCFYDRRGVAVAGFLLGGLLGSISGLIIGARFEKMAWEPVRLPMRDQTAHVDFKVSARSGLGLRLTF